MWCNDKEKKMKKVTLMKKWIYWLSLSRQVKSRMSSFCLSCPLMPQVSSLLNVSWEFCDCPLAISPKTMLLQQPARQRNLLQLPSCVRTWRVNPITFFSVWQSCLLMGHGDRTVVRKMPSTPIFCVWNPLGTQFYSTVLRKDENKRKNGWGWPVLFLSCLLVDSHQTRLDLDATAWKS